MLVQIPIIKHHCIDGTIFASDFWKAYGKLDENVQLEDCLHFPVNHSQIMLIPKQVLRRKQLKADGAILRNFSLYVG